MRLSRKTVHGFGSERDAVCASTVLSETPGFEAFPLVVLVENGQWFLECYDDGASAKADASTALSNAGVTIRSQAIVPVPEKDWVAETQRLLPPVRAGGFTVHGSHDRGRVFSHWAIEIDAGRAFGTAHHGTTKGCLEAIARLRAVKPRTVLDLGTGSGVLAVAAAKAFSHRARIMAADIDPIAIAVARENCRKNGVAGNVSLFVGDGLKPGLAYALAPFDIVLANILAKPLLKLAPRLSALTKRGGILVLSGMLTEQAREVLASYAATGFFLAYRQDLEGWATLTLQRAR